MDLEKNDVTQTPILPHWIDGVAQPCSLLRLATWGEIPIDLEHIPARSVRLSTAPPPVPARPKTDSFNRRLSGQPPAIPSSGPRGPVSGQNHSFSRASTAERAIRASAAPIAFSSKPTLPKKPKLKTPEDELQKLVNEVVADANAAASPVQNLHIRKTGKEWFSEIFNETYYLTLPSKFHSRTLREVSFIVASLQLAKGAKILDLGCGFGRHLIKMAERGYEMVGYDLSTPLLQQASNESHRRGLQVEFYLGDMRNLNFKNAFDGLICMHSTFGYFDEDTNFDVLYRIARSLRKGGRLLLEVVNRDWVINNLPPGRVWWENGSTSFLEEIGFVHATSVLKIKRQIVIETKTPWEQNIRIRIYSYQELISQMRQVGLRVLEISGDIAYKGSYLGTVSRHLFVLAEKVE